MDEVEDDANDDIIHEWDQSDDCNLLHGGGVSFYYKIRLQRKLWSNIQVINATNCAQTMNFI